MKNELKKVLDTLNRVDFIELRHALDFADMVHSIKRVYSQTDEDMMDELDVTEKEITSMCSGSYKWDIMMWAKLEALQDRLSKAKRDAEKLEKFNSENNG